MGIPREQTLHALIMFTKNLSDGYVIKEMEPDIFWPLWETHSPAIFRDSIQNFPWRQHLSETEIAAMKELNKNKGTPYKLLLGLYQGDEFVGWSFGDQKNVDCDYYMRNSAVLPHHRRQGLYSELLKVHLEIVSAKGFQKISSNHHPTNNSVIIPKLKAGFVITGMEMDDGFGMLVQLTYFTNSLRREVMDVRTGYKKPNEEVMKALGLKA